MCYLRGAGVCPRCGERDVAGLVALDHRVVLHDLAPPNGSLAGVAVDAELGHESCSAQNELH